MMPWRELGRATVTGEDSPLVLSQRDNEFAIRIGQNTLMSSRAHGSEEMLAELACVHLPERADSRLLVGGLGMGFTLAAALRHLPVGAQVVVAELVPAVLEWNRGPLAHLAERPLDDPRAVVIVSDVADIIGANPGAWDAILLDVDNGPNGLTHARNDRLYSAAGLQAAFAALRDHGVLGVWSVAPDADFTRRLERTGFDVHETAVRARRTKGGWHTLWIATAR